MNDVQALDYPDVGQSFGIAITLIFSLLIFSPVTALKYFIGAEVSDLLYYLIAIGVPFFFIHRTRTKETGVSSYRIDLGHYQLIPVVMLASIALFIGICLPLAGSIPMPEGIKKFFLEVGGPHGISRFIKMVIVVPILEELICRGVILDGLLKKYSPMKAIIVSSLIFGIIHLNPWQFVSALFAGFFIGWVYYKTRNLLLPIAIHATVNLFGFVSSFFTSEEARVASPAEMCGGTINLLIIIGVANVILIGLLYYLHGYFSKIALSSPFAGGNIQTHTIIETDSPDKKN